MSENTSSSWYEDAFSDLLETRLDKSYFNFFHEHQDKLRFTESKSVLSIGVGTGDVDTYIASRCMPQVRSYTGLEPSPVNCAAFVRNMKKQCPQLEVDAFCGRDDEYPGPPSKVDILLYMNVLYYCPKPIETIQRGLQWLKDDGFVCIAHGKDCFWPRMPGTDIVSISYVYDDLIKDLKSIGVKVDNYDDEDLTYTQFFDATDPSKDMCNYLLNKEGSEDEIQAVKEYIERWQISGKLEGYYQALCLPKSAFV